MCRSRRLCRHTYDGGLSLWFFEWFRCSSSASCLSLYYFSTFLLLYRYGLEVELLWTKMIFILEILKTIKFEATLRWSNMNVSLIWNIQVFSNLHLLIENVFLAKKDIRLSNTFNEALINEVQQNASSLSLFVQGSYKWEKNSPLPVNLLFVRTLSFLSFCVRAISALFLPSSYSCLYKKKNMSWSATPVPHMTFCAIKTHSRRAKKQYLGSRRKRHDCFSALLLSRQTV
jgi:hypothetical protein